MSFLRNRLSKSLKHFSEDPAPNVVRAKFQDGSEPEITQSLKDSRSNSLENSSMLSDPEEEALRSIEASLEEMEKKDGGSHENAPSPSSQPKPSSSDERDRKVSKMTAVVLSTDQEIYEMQLTQLQEQLVATMIENQSLSEELQTLKKTSSAQRLKDELALEKAKNEVLIKKCEDMCQEMGTEFKYGESNKKNEEVQMGDGSLEQDTDSLDAIALAEDAIALAEKAVDAEVVDPVTEGGPKRRTWAVRLQQWLMQKLYEIAEDFTEDESEAVAAEGPPLTVKMLRKNVNRFGDGIKPLLGTFKGIHGVLSWNNPSLSFVWFFAYMYFVWCGWFLPFVLFLLIVRLFANYLRQGGWNMNLQYFDTQDVETKLEDDDKEKDKPGTFTIVLQVTRKVQNILGDLADRLEKINNLLTWEQPREARDLFFTLCFVFIITCLVRGQTLAFCVGLYLGVKLFLIDNLYNRFPRLRRKYDREYKMWQALMTNEQLEKVKQRKQVEKVMLGRSPSSTEETVSLWDTGEGVLPKQDKKFCDKFELPHAEAPLKGWSRGKKCLMLNKDKMGPSAVKPGLLYLTRSFLCWEKTGVASQNQTLTLPLAEIEALEKYKPFAILPGSGMAILVRVSSREKPYIFGGLFNRDENFASIMEVGRRERLPWAVSCESSMPPSGKVRLSQLSDDG